MRPSKRYKASERESMKDGSMVNTECRVVIHGNMESGKQDVRVNEITTICTTLDEARAWQE